MNSTRPAAATTTKDAATRDAELTEQVLQATELVFNDKERDIILQTCCGNASREEAAQLIAIAEARGLNPIKGECYFVKRYDMQKQQEVWAVQASIDSFRIKADETGLYDGQDEPEFEYASGQKLPTLVRVKVYRKGISRPFVGVARYDEYVQKKKDGSPTRFWATMPHNQLAKCAEALAFRKAFPSRFAKVYSPEEMSSGVALDEASSEPSQTPRTAQQWDELTGEIIDDAAEPSVVDHAGIAADLKTAIDEAKKSGDKAARTALVERIKSADLPEALISDVRDHYRKAFSNGTKPQPQAAT